MVFSLPRSRSAWLSRFLTYGDWHCGHDELRHMRQLEDVRSWLSQPNTGSVETAAAPFWRLGLDLRPDLQVVTIRRDPEAVTDSLLRCGFTTDRPTMLSAMRRLDRRLDQIEACTGAWSCGFDDLVREDVCAELFERLLPYRHDRRRWAALNGENVQISIPALTRYVAAHWPQINRLNEIARRESIALLTRERAQRRGSTKGGASWLS